MAKQMAKWEKDYLDDIDGFRKFCGLSPKKRMTQKELEEFKAGRIKFSILMFKIGGVALIIFLFIMWAMY